MNEFNGLLTATVFLPALGALVLLIGPDNRLFSRFIATSVAAGDFVLAVLVFALFDRTDMASRFQFLDQWVWISSDAIKSTYLLGLFLIIVQTFLYKGKAACANITFTLG